MKRLLLLTTSLALIVPELAMAGAAPVQDRPSAARPPQDRPPGARPPGTRPPQPRPPMVRPPRPQPPQVRPPVARPPQRPPHRPGYRPPNFRPIAGPAFRYPRGYSYRRWRVGLLLPALFLSQAYYYDNYYGAGFGAPPRGYRWVRYGPDLLLVNTRTRRIADVIYNVFR